MKDMKFFIYNLKYSIWRIKRNNTKEILQRLSPIGYEEMLPVLGYSHTPNKEGQSIYRKLLPIISFGLLCNSSATLYNYLVGKEFQAEQQPGSEEERDTINIRKLESISDLHTVDRSSEGELAFNMQFPRCKSEPTLDNNDELDISLLSGTGNAEHPDCHQLSPIDELASPNTNTSGTIDSVITESRPSEASTFASTTLEKSSQSVFFKMFSGESSSSIFTSKDSECPICKCRSSNFGRELKEFEYSVLQKATNNFSQENFLSEGGFGMVYMGRLEDGQYIAVKQRKQANSLGEKEFRSEVEVLGYAQHRNLVTLLGYFFGENCRLLVYEYVCKESLDKHLLPGGKVLPWHYRIKIAEGTARGLRYLHEECRAGSIVHRDLRPNKILVNHDFEPRLGEFGLARPQKPVEADNETKVIGTFGYLAPEYVESGKVSTKTDVYSFGMVLLELITGRRTLDSTPPGQSLLTWARPLLKNRRYYDLIDPKLVDSYDVHELYCMVRAARLCLRKDPNARPSMNQVVQILEGSLMNQLEEDSPTMSGGASIIQIIETSPPYFERASR